MARPKGIRNAWWWVLGLFVFLIFYNLAWAPALANSGRSILDDCILGIFDGQWKTWARECLSSGGGGFISFEIWKWSNIVLFAVLVAGIVIGGVQGIRGREGGGPSPRRKPPTDPDRNEVMKQGDGIDTEKFYGQTGEGR